MASIRNSTLKRNLIIAYVVLVAASVIGRLVGEGALDEAFWIKTLIGTGIVTLMIGAVAWLVKKAYRPDSPLKQSDIQSSQDIQSPNISSYAVEDQLYAVVADELAAGSIEKGAWTQAFSEADGNDAKAKAFYIKIRVRQLQREAERNAQHRAFEGESQSDRIRSILDKLGKIPYEDTDHISRNGFRGSRSSLLEPVSVSTASSVSGLLDFQVIDLIKRGFLKGVYDEDEWFFDLNRQDSI